jgi:thiol-disulfide isomerase/thioredoxin
MPRPPRLGLAAFTFTIAFVATACSSAPPSDAGTAVRVADHGLDGATTDFDRFERVMFSLRGTPVVVNLWASWCGPCADEMPALVDAAARYGDRIRFLGVDTEDQRGAARTFMDDHGVSYASLFDPDGSVHDGLGFVGLPDTIFYAADGSIASTWSGPLTASALRDHLDALVASPT